MLLYSPETLHCVGFSTDPLLWRDSRLLISPDRNVPFLLHSFPLINVFVIFFFFHQSFTDQFLLKCSLEVSVAGWSTTVKNVSVPRTLLSAGWARFLVAHGSGRDQRGTRRWVRVSQRPVLQRGDAAGV